MTDKTKEVLKLALDWIEGNGKYDAAKRIAQTIREALAEESSGIEQPDMNLNCKSVQARLATSWGYVKAEQPAQFDSGIRGPFGSVAPPAPPRPRFEPSAPQQVVEHAPCQGMNCGITRTDQEHSPECQAEHAATIAGGKFVKPAQQQEPVAYIHRHGNHLEVSERFLCDDEKARGWTEEPLYTAPPYEATPLASQRSVKPWLRLTDEEAIFLIENEILGRGDLIEAIEAKLKEKNA